MREGALAQRFELPVDGERRARDRSAVECERFVAVGANHCDVAIAQMHDVLRVTHEGRDVGGDEHLPLADAENHGASVAGDDDRLRALRIDDGEAVGADDETQRGANRVDERVRVHGRDEMGDDFRIRLGAEHDALRLELRAKCTGVFDDAVVDDRVPIARVAVRVRVPVARLAVRGPAGVRDAGRPLRCLGEQPLQVAHLALALEYLQFAAICERDARRVVAAIFETVQPFHQDGRSLLFTDVTDDSTHATRS
jgi:hypothetical protein